MLQACRTARRTYSEGLLAVNILYTTSHNTPIRLTSSLPINIRDRALYNSRIQEPPVEHSEALLRLVLGALALLPRSCDRLERSGRYRVVDDPMCGAVRCDD